jgi:hypothetical protein
MSVKPKAPWYNQSVLYPERKMDCRASLAMTGRCNADGPDCKSLFGSFSSEKELLFL